MPAYFFVPSSPGSPIAIKKYVSVPTVSFETGFDNPISLKEEEDSYVLGSNDPTIPLDEQPNRKLDQQADGWRQQKIYPVFSSISDSSNLRRQYSDPVASSESQSSNSATEGSVKVIGKTSKGETVYSGRSLEGLEIIFTK